MKTPLLFAMLPMLIAVPKVSAATELETLRARCSEQEQQIQDLKAQVRTLHGEDTHPQSSAKSTASYTVRPGDSLERIARRNHCEAATLAKTNGLKLNSVILPGQKLKLPDASIARNSTSASSTSSTSSTSAASAASAASAPKTHKILDGETYYSISRKYGIPVKTLMVANPSAKATALYPGLVIRLAPAEPKAAQSKPKPAVAESTPKPAPAPATLSSTPKTQTVSAPAKQAKAPVTAPESAVQSPPKDESPTPAPEKKIRSVTIEGEMTYADFAAKHGTDTSRLNDLNGLDLTNATVLAKGSELYVPAQP